MINITKYGRATSSSLHPAKGARSPWAHKYSQLILFRCTFDLIIFNGECLYGQRCHVDSSWHPSITTARVCTHQRDQSHSGRDHTQRPPVPRAPAPYPSWRARGCPWTPGPRPRCRPSRAQQPTQRRCCCCCCSRDRDRHHLPTRRSPFLLPLH